MVKCANDAVAVLVEKVMRYCSNYAKHYASTIYLGLDCAIIFNLSFSLNTIVVLLLQLKIKVTYFIKS